jgi:hypothetical protein
MSYDFIFDSAYDFMYDLHAKLWGDQAFFQHRLKITNWFWTQLLQQIVHEIIHGPNCKFEQTLTRYNFIFNKDDTLTFLPSADYKVVCKRPWNHFLTLPHPPQTLLQSVSKSSPWQICWLMTHEFDICGKCDTWRKCDMHDMCHTVTLWHNKVPECNNMYKFANWALK